MTTYAALPPQVDLPALERSVLELWRSEGTFARSLEQSGGREPWVFYEGPPTANGMPGTHHVEARVFKDAFPRYRTMKGRFVPRKAGWDCHGLPVELAVEKELGFSGKKDIEAYGIAEFNARCRASVERHVDAFELMTERMGYWVDMSQAYRTMDPEYVDSVWWALKQIADKGLLVEDYRIAPWCPRDETTLSDHELGQPGGYETVVDPSVFVRFPLTSGPLAGEASLLVWTTTPWTLVSNTAVAVNPAVTYVVATDGSERLVVAEPLLASALGEGWTVERTFSGTELERWRYARPFELLAWPEGEDGHFVLLADYVTTEDGTGLVHQSPAFGADDLATCRAYGLPVVTPVRRDGTFDADLPLVGGMFFKTADPSLVADLDARGRLFRHVPYEHSYPHCWRCHTALIYYATPSWYIRTTARKDELLRENERTTWYPETVKWGRYGDWLRGNVDWALSRSRYWGTPLPVWRCTDGHVTVVGSRAELGALAGRDLSSLDPHRPYVDEVALACPECGAEARRVPEVIDGWFDSGAMPFAQWGYPWVEGSEEKLAEQYPAQFICEAQDQTRGWFYSLMAVGTLVFDRSSYENVLCLGLILAEDGKKMSKHLGNVLQPIPLMDEHGADALRWFMFASGSPWAARRVGHHALQEVVRKVLLTYWNTASFLSLYGRTAGFEPFATPAPPLTERPLLDRWALSEAHRLAREVDAAMEVFDAQRVGALLARYVDDLSNWYVRRSRRRFWDGDPAALATLHECLYVLTLLLAPVVPFVTERVWRDLFASTSDQLPASVHLATWPRVDGSLVDDELAGQMALVRRVVELGRSARTEHKVRTRQPLAEVAVLSRDWAALPADLRAIAREELNVVSEGALSGDEALVTRTAKPNFRALGKRFGKRTPVVAAAVAAADPAQLATTSRVLVEGEEVALEADDFTVTETPKEGWAVASEPGLSVALDLTLTPELVRAGLAREVVRLVQDARKSSGFEVSDRIALWWQPTGEQLTAALAEHADLVAREVLAVSAAAGPGPEGSREVRDDELGLVVWLQRA
ncbi:isoleucyl-tRNA synthetase [Motilibacter rhizosphaerae]|uniref:Isoleucine--tRNA ligase n=1 Tax=Motilibacter rhizosphaerae TaxID=598652 RepID=A0A4V2F3F2_9ACTN|nr:isoleucine--tRNA ligase [Motilibacter rhizosphaerae]RZS82903.1 isoleucyl-tRNA synthetase [Motilibacter rhizosphaerae]